MTWNSSSDRIEMLNKNTHICIWCDFSSILIKKFKIFKLKCHTNSNWEVRTVKAIRRVAVYAYVTSIYERIENIQII